MSTLAPRFHGISTICALALAMSAACGDNGEVGEVPVDASPQPDGRAHVTTTVFLNFDGARLTKDYPNDATADISLYVRPPGVTIRHGATACRRAPPASRRSPNGSGASSRPTTSTS